MHGLILMRILVRIRVLHHASSGLRFQDGPGAIMLFQIVGDLHTATGRGAGLRPELNLGMGLASVNGNIANIHLHGADVQRADGLQVLQDAGTNGVIVAGLVLASANGAEGGENQNDFAKSSGAHVHFS